THGVHAEPTTFGLKLAVWAFELDRARRRVARGLEGMRVGKLSGAVGQYAAIDPEVERVACERLGLEPAAASTQILQRDRHAELLAALAVCASSLDKFALEIRHLARTEVREVEEPFAPGQKGSSAMPHKRNPVRAERMRRNLDSSHGLYFSQRLLLSLVESGLERDEAYRLVQRHAMRAWDEEQDFRELVRGDSEIAGRVEVDKVFDEAAYTEHVGTVFE